MENIKQIVLHAQEVKNGAAKFISCNAEINEKWYKVKFTKTCPKVPHERGLYDLTVSIDDLSLEKGKPYVNKQGKKAVSNDVLWVRNCIELRKYTEEDFAEANRQQMAEIFGD